MSVNTQLGEAMRKRGLLSVAEAATLARVSKSTIYRWIEDKKITTEETGVGTFVTRTSVLQHLGPTLCQVYGIR